jgi:DNA-binding GntR family transcriptional regulator
VVELSDRSRLERFSTAAHVAKLLRRRITEGEIKPGERLNELVLAAELRVSRSPIREALALLAGEGLVRIAPYRGAFVTELSRERLADLLDFRIALEQFAVRRIIDRADAKDFDRLEKLVEALRKRARAKDFSGAVEVDLQLHEELIALAKSPLLSQTFKELLGEFRLYIAATSRHYKGIGELATEHAALLAALRKGRQSKALALVANHIMHGFASAQKDLRS